MIPSPASLVLVDDHAVVRQALQNLIEQLGDYRVTGSYDDGGAFLQALPLHPPPDLVLLDLSMPVADGREVMRVLAARGLDYPVLVLTNEVSQDTILALIRLGARGYLAKACTAAELRAALEAVLRTGYYHSELEYAARQAERAGTAHASQPLTPREIEFLRFVCHKDEPSYKQIADRMDVATRTVDGYREALFQKCGVKTKVGLVFYALKHGLVALADV